MAGEYGGTSGLQWEGKDPNEGIQFAALVVDMGLTELLNIKIDQGRTFSPDFGSEGNKIIFNQAAIDAMELEDPIGKTVQLWNRDMEIIGLAENFHLESLYDPLRPAFIYYIPDSRHVVVKFAADQEKEALPQLAQLYESFNNGLPFDYHFVDEDLQKMYAPENRLSILSRYFSGLAILISCLGLLGLAAFSAERRRKEISIRKVLGASVFGLIKLLSIDFTKMVLLAIVIALPLSFMLAKDWLNGFSYRIDLEWWFFVVAGLLALLIAGLTVGLQTLKGG